MDFFVSFMRSNRHSEPLHRGWLAVVLTFILAWVVTQVFIPKVRTFALKVGWADRPNARRLNREPWQMLGDWLFMQEYWLDHFSHLSGSIVIAKVQAQILAILLGGSVLVLVGFIDDQFGLPTLFRLLVQILAACCLLLAALKSIWCCWTTLRLFSVDSGYRFFWMCGDYQCSQSDGTGWMD